MQRLELSETLYDTLNTKASGKNITIEALIERLLILDDFDWYPEILDDSDPDWAAFERLTTLFADVPIELAQPVMEEPMFELSNFSLLDDLK